MLALILVYAKAEGGKNGGPLPDRVSCGLCPPYWVARAPGCDGAPRAPDSFIKAGAGGSGWNVTSRAKDG